MPEIKKLRLPRLPVGWKDQDQLFERYWDDAMTKLETTLNAILDIPELQTAIVAAQQAADNANAAADTASSQAVAQAKEQSLVNSYVDGFTAPLLTVDEDGTVVIKTHQRVYGDTSLDPSVSVTGATVETMTTAGATIRIYYDDAARSGGAVSYQWTVDPATPPVQGGIRHSVGVVTIPAAGQPVSNGEYIRPPGYVPGRNNNL